MADSEQEALGTHTHCPGCPQETLGELRVFKPGRGEGGHTSFARGMWVPLCSRNHPRGQQDREGGRCNRG